MSLQIDIVLTILAVAINLKHDPVILTHLHPTLPPPLLRRPLSVNNRIPLGEHHLFLAIDRQLLLVVVEHEERARLGGRLVHILEHAPFDRLVGGAESVGVVRGGRRGDGDVDDADEGADRAVTGSRYQCQLGLGVRRDLRDLDVTHDARI